MYQVQVTMKLYLQHRLSGAIKNTENAVASSQQQEPVVIEKHALDPSSKNLLPLESSLEP